MDLNFNKALAKNYKSNSQKARVLTESWVKENLYCLRCGNVRISKEVNNKPVHDFICPNCGNCYELKSKSSRIISQITDGAYRTMLEQIEKKTNPDFLLLSYDPKKLAVESLFIVPKHFFTTQIIVKRKPLAITARRSGWVGCNILLSDIP